MNFSKVLKPLFSCPYLKKLFYIGYKAVAKYGYKEEDIEHIIRSADVNGNGVIDYSGKHCWLLWDNNVVI